MGSSFRLMKKVKPTRVMILVNTLHSINANVYANHVHMIGYSAKHIPGLEFRFFAPHRMSIDNARNTAAKYALEMECDYVLFLDDDVQVPPESLKLLLEANKDIVAGLVMIRGYPFHVMGFKWGMKKNTDTKKKVKSLIYFDDLAQERLIKKEGKRGFWVPESKIKERYGMNGRQWSKLPMRLTPLQPMAAIGFSLCLIKTDILKAMEEPYFLTSSSHTEDVYFCMKATESLTPKPSIYMHTGVQCGHMLNAEPIEFASMPLFKAFYGMMYGKEEVPFSRNEDYIAACLAEIQKREAGK